ncbi:MAG: hypothetical protein ACOYMG_27920 [Candidatus Methylumidiphilus sp.]
MLTYYHVSCQIYKYMIGRAKDLIAPQNAALSAGDTTHTPCHMTHLERLAAITSSQVPDRNSHYASIAVIPAWMPE